MSNEPWHDKETLERLYHGEGLSQKEVAEELGCSRETVLAWMDKLDVDARHANGTRYYDKRERLRQSKEEIIEKYESGAALYVLAEEYGVNDATLKRFLNDQGVATRDISDQLKESDLGRDEILADKEVLEQLYIGEKLSARQIAERTDRSYSAVNYWLDEHDIPKRDRAEAISLARSGFNIHTGTGGYEYIHHDSCVVRHHRLLATLLVDGLDELDGMHVHHESEVEWHNAVDNLSVKGVKEHLSHHHPHMEAE